MMVSDGLTPARLHACSCNAQLSISQFVGKAMYLHRKHPHAVCTNYAIDVASLGKSSILCFRSRPRPVILGLCDKYDPPSTPPQNYWSKNESK
eukprot:3383559-Amphidinium_carterae.1